MTQVTTSDGKPKIDGVDEVANPTYHAMEATLKRVRSSRSTAFSYWRTDWQPAQEAIWQCVAADGDCFWHSLSTIVGAEPTALMVQQLKGRVLCQADEVLQEWVKIYGGTVEGLQQELSALAQPGTWADWRAVALTAYEFRVPLVVWEQDHGTCSVFWSHLDQSPPSQAWLLKLTKDHFWPATLMADFQHIMSDLFRPCLASKLPRLAGGGRPLDCQDHLMDPLATTTTRDVRWLDKDSQQDSLRITTLNVTSLKKHIHDVLTLDAHIIVATEIRVSKDQMPELTALTHSYGWHVVWGAAAEMVGSGSGGLCQSSDCSLP